MASGYAVVDQTSVLATHLAEIVRQYAHELLTRQETKRLLDAMAEAQPKLVDELVPRLLTLGEVQKVLQQLLREQVSIRDLSYHSGNLAGHRYRQQKSRRPRRGCAPGTCPLSGPAPHRGRSQTQGACSRPCNRSRNFSANWIPRPAEKSPLQGLALRSARSSKACRKWWATKSP